MALEGRVFAPQDGMTHGIEDVSDPIFAQKVLGDGIFIKPRQGRVLSPVDGVVVSVAPTGHAFGLRASDGAELLVHIGIDTVELDGVGFEPQVAAGQSVRTGDQLCLVDLPLVTRAGYSTETVIVLIKGTDFEVTARRTGRHVAAGDVVIEYRQVGSDRTVGPAGATALPA